jgi:hypothetical protein
LLSISSMSYLIFFAIFDVLLCFTCLGTCCERA